MTIYSLPSSAMSENIPSGAVIALGFFDGVHLGHRLIIDTARREAEVRGAFPGVWMISSGNKEYKSGSPYLVSEQDKLALLYEAGAKFVASYDFFEIRDLDGESFVADVLKRDLKASCVVCGFNFRFGKGASCNVDDLRRICARYGIDVTVSDAVTDVFGECISSTRIRQLIAEGDVSKAALMLGRPYSFTSVVLEGKKLGRRLGFPTVNQIPDGGRLIPERGVYAVSTEFELNGTVYSYPGAANIGFCPTVTKIESLGADVQEGAFSAVGAASEGHAVCETYIADFEGDLYGKNVKISFLERLRPETKFDSTDELKLQIRHDADRAVEIYNEIYGKKKND